MPFVVRSALLPLLLALLLVPAAAQAQDTGTYTSPALEWGQSYAWVDFNADHKADFCRVSAAGELQCTLSTGKGFGATIAAPAVDAGYADGRLWGDVDGNGGADYCRRVGGPEQYYSCTLSAHNSFAPYLGPTQLSEWGEVPDAALADATGDGKADFCRLATDRAICSPYATDSFTPGFAATVGVGDPTGRAWVDVNGDGRADFCRVAGALVCTFSNGTAFGSTQTTPGLDLGYEGGRTWADIDGDRKADYCRRVGAPVSDPRISCTLATASGFGANYVSEPMDWGNDTGWAFADFDGDGDRDYCRAVGAAPSAQLFCTLWSPSGFGQTIVSGPIDTGYAAGRAWVDHNADGKADYCRLVGPDQRVACTTSLGNAFGAIPDPTPPPPPPPPPPPVKKTRLVVTLSYDYSVKGRYTRLPRLQVKGVPAGATVKVTCKKGCSRKKYSVKKKKRGTVSLKTVVRKRLKSGTTIRVVVSRPGNLAAIKTLKVRSSKRPTVKTG